MEKPLLRSTLKKLRALPLDEANHYNVMMVPQEMLDFLAMRAGIKPVFLLGRGFDDKQWIEGAIAMARKAGLHVVEGTMWDAKPDDEALPAWFRDHLEGVQPKDQAFYICRTRATADAVQKSFGPPQITSFHMCPACAADKTRAAAQLSKKYEELAMTVDRDLAAQIAKNQEGVGQPRMIRQSTS
jgi:hypothetical protein